MSKFTSSPAADKPAKPYPDFQLFPHATGRWAKKIRGRLHYFGKWNDPDGALNRYLEQKDDLHAGRTPRSEVAALLVKDVANAYLIAKKELREAGELSPRTWAGYKVACDLMVEELGKRRPVSDLRADDFAALRNKLAKRWGPHRLSTTLQCIRSAFKHAYEADLIAAPMRFGPQFKGASKKTFRIHRAKQGLKLFEREEVRALVLGALVVGPSGPELVRAGTTLRAMILFGINCGFGNADVGNLPLAAVDLDSGWVDYPRPKTGINRRCPLWPETVAGLREALADRPEPKDVEDAGLFFVTKYGQGWAKATSANPVTAETRKVMKALGINSHRNFYTLRHTFRTVADEAKDQPAADFIMGHESSHMSSVYRERISDARLKAVTDHVRRWLFNSPEESTP